MRIFPEPGPSLPRLRSLLIHGQYHVSAPIHLCLSIAPADHAILLTPSRQHLLDGLRNQNDKWINSHSGTGAVANISSRVNVFYPPSPKHLVAILSMLRTHDTSSLVMAVPKVTITRAPTLLILHEPSAYFLSEQEEHTVSSYLLLITHALSAVEYLSSQSSTPSAVSLFVFDSKLDQLKLPVLRTPSRSILDERDGDDDIPRPEPVLFFAEKYFEFSGTCQTHEQPDSDLWASMLTFHRVGDNMNNEISMSWCCYCRLTVYTHLLYISVNHQMSSDSDPSLTGFVSFILKPGSSLHPGFLLAVDIAFAFLFLIFVWSAYLTNGNVHFFALMAIELALWASVKWFVQELGRLPTTQDNDAQKKDQ